MSQWLPKFVRVFVVGGCGSITISGAGGRACAVGVIAPVDEKGGQAKAKYDITAVDADGFVLYFGDDVEGNVNMEVNAQIHDTHSVIITDASRDGVYKVKIWFGNY